MSFVQLLLGDSASIPTPANNNTTELNQEEEEIEEEHYVVIEFPELDEEFSKTIIDTVNNYSLAGFQKQFQNSNNSSSSDDTIWMKLDQTLWKGHLQDSIGSCLIFQQQENTPKLQYFCKTNKKLILQQVHALPLQPALLPSAATTTTTTLDSSDPLSDPLQFLELPKRRKQTQQQQEQETEEEMEEETEILDEELI